MNFSTSIRPINFPRWSWLIIVYAGLFRFINLDFLDLQAWDEALYAIRAEGILRFGDWLDQSAFAIDGLYSALHPPLYVWLTALSFEALGVNEFSARLVSALAGFGTLPLIVMLGKRMGNSATGIVAALLFGLNPFVTFYARQGQFDTLLVFFLTLSAYFVVRIYEDRSWRSSILAGLALGAALMTKLFVALGLPIAAFTFLLTYRKQADPALIRRLLAFIGVAVLIAAPWHVFMMIRHGDPWLFVKHSAFLDRMVFGIEGNVKPLEVFYYFNQALVLFPIGIVFFLAGLRNSLLSHDPARGLLVHWFAVFFFVFSIMRTKLAVYFLPLLVPFSLIASAALDRLIIGEYRRRPWFLALAGTFLTSLWASNQDWRTALKDLISSGIRIQLPDASILMTLGIMFTLAVFAVVLSFLLTNRSWSEQIRQPILVSLLIGLGLWSVTTVFVEDRDQYRDGAAALSSFIADQHISRMVVGGNGPNPQLTFYLRGADLSWQDGLSVRRITPPTEPSEYRAWLVRETTGEPRTSLIVLEKDKFVRYRTVDPQQFVPTDFRLVFESRRYSGFVRVSEEFLAWNGRRSETTTGAVF